ncbi:endonuclease/exonuclease/phosphatase family protein [Streptomyces sp. SBT349]|uniref:endonuclease/exonuclease/phosphatase family protein n=1 Tax=Streptomyces sp. SBT349 TaxID=1580539 RepID=UPI00066E257C|nr:endonuclease/exonuclease/phosphatase family protein [Streptomyces sp. SBT349]
MDDEIVVLCWNVEHNERDRRDPGNARAGMARVEIMARYGANLVLRQELTGAADDGRGPLWMEANALGLFPSLAPATPESPNPTGVLVCPNTFEIQHEYEHVTNGWHPICNPVIKLKGTSKPLSLASLHLCSYDPDTRFGEARRLLFLAAQGRSALIGGDTNDYPHRPEPVALPDWKLVQDPILYEQRTIWRGSERVSSTEVDRILAGVKPGGHVAYEELGWYASNKLDLPEALKPTASLRRTDQGSLQRIDRMFATPDVARCLISLDVDDSDEVGDVSDHALVAARLSRARLQRALTLAT